MHAAHCTLHAALDIPAMSTKEQISQRVAPAAPAAPAATGQRRRRTSAAWASAAWPPASPYACHPRSFDQVRNEHQYLVASLHQQDERVQVLLRTLAGIQAQQMACQSPAEARKRRKDAGFVQSKIADAEQQERLILVRLLDVWTEMQHRNRVAYLQYLQQQQQQPPPLDASTGPRLWIPVQHVYYATPTLHTPFPNHPMSATASVFCPGAEAETPTQTEETASDVADPLGLGVPPNTPVPTRRASDAMPCLSLDRKRMSLPPPSCSWNLLGE